jgi:hypothetical protein
MIRIIRRALRRMRSDDSGLSLAEVLVSGLLTVAILAMIGTMLVSVAKLTAQSTQTSKSNNVASNIANAVTSVLRVATPKAVAGQIIPDPAIYSGTRESLIIYSLSDVDPSSPAPVRVTYTIADTPGSPRHVFEERCKATVVNGFYTWPAPPTCAAANYSKRDLGGIVQPVTGTTDQFFTYYSAPTATQPNGVEIPIAAGNLSPAQLKTVTSIRAYVSIKADGSENKPAVIANQVVMGNLGLDNTES